MDDELHDLTERLKDLLAQSAGLHSENERLREELSEALAHLEEGRAILADHTARLKADRHRRGHT